MNIKILFTTLTFILIFSQNFFAQRIITMERMNNTYHIPCKVNGIPMNFIFDTGASDVSISITEAKFLIKQGLLKEDDLLEKVQYQIANGDIIEGTKVNLKTIEIGGIILKNVKASVIDNQGAPLLLGQSAINKIGKYTINGNKLILLDYSPVSEIEKESLEPGTVSINEDALNYFNLFLNSKSWVSEDIGKLALDKYSKTLNFNGVTVIQNPMTEDDKTTISINYSIPVENIIKIKEVVHRKDPNKTSDANILMISVILSKETKYSSMITKRGDLPKQETSYREKIGLRITKSISDTDMKNIRLALRELFTGISFDTSEL